ncbi:MAG: response regulator [Dorea sp.]|jgi:signal transduction histidine kinase/CheY-like chemotaxis protein|nr:response regulator [Dorea sp.]
MGMILEYIEYHLLPLALLLAAIIFSVWCLGLYLREKSRAAEMEASVAGERGFFQSFAVNRGDFFLVIRQTDLRVLYISPNFEEMTGMSAKRVCADIEVLKSMVSPKAARNMTEQLRNWDGEQELKLEFDYRRIVADQAGAQESETGKEGQRHGVVSLQLDENRACYLVVFCDNTEDYKIRSTMKEELEQAYQESQAKTDFLSKMSHEIRTPMNGILGMLSLARSHVKDPEQTDYYLNRAESLSQFLLTLINDILDMSRIESGKMELEAVSFDLFRVAEKLDSMFRNTTEAKNIRWEITMQDFDVSRVVGDELRLTQVIINFISNAVKFTPAGGAVSVTFRQMHKIEGKMHLMIRVRDTGKGIKADFISRIFRPFEQEDASTAHHYGGSGLGMAIADNIVKLMDGQIIVESEEGKGSEFVVYISLPIAGGEQTVPESWNVVRQEEEEGDIKKAIEEFTLEGIRLLLAEDNDVNAEIAIEIMEMEGAVLERACDGLEAVRMFEESPAYGYDAILMDIQMPNMNGWEAAAQIRRSSRPDADIPIFAMSANAFVEDKRHSIEIGMNGHISKPVDYDEVRELVGEALLRRSHEGV